MAEAKTLVGDVVGGAGLDQAKLRGAKHHGRLAAETIDLGNEPPLSVDGGNSAMIDRLRVSAQWFSGTILTGVCGAALKKKYAAPSFSYLDFLRIDKPPAAKAPLKEEELCSSLS